MDELNHELELLNEIKNSNSAVGAIYLSKKLNMPQATIGRRMTKLEQKGYIEKLSNKGRIITEEGLQYLEEKQNEFHIQRTASKLVNMVEDTSKERLFEIIEIRKLLEQKTVELACYNATEKDIQQLENILFEQAYDFKHGGFGSEQDLKFHLLIAKLSGNFTMMQILKLLLTEDNVYTKFSYVAEHVKNLGSSQHNSLISAIKEKNVVLAKEEMLRHLEQVAEDVRLYMPN